MMLVEFSHFLNFVGCELFEELNKIKKEEKNEFLID